MLLFNAESKLFNRFPMLTPDTSIAAAFNDESEDDDLTDKSDDDDIGADDLIEEDESGDKEEDESEDDNTKKKDKLPEPKGITQEDLDRIIDRTIARERTKYEKLLAEQTQKAETERIEKEEKKIRESIISKAAKRYMDRNGYDEETARELAEEDAEKDLRVMRLERELQASKQNSEQVTRIVSYAQQKADMLVKQPLAAKFVKEIDAFAQNGAALDFETAMNFVLGQKLASGELLNDIKSTAEQKTLRNIQSRKNKTVEKDGLPGDSSKQVSLTPQERKMAKNFGMTEKEWAANKPGKTKNKR